MMIFLSVGYGRLGSLRQKNGWGFSRPLVSKEVIKAQAYAIYVYEPRASKSHCLMVPLEGTLPAAFTFPLITRAGMDITP